LRMRQQGNGARAVLRSAMSELLWNVNVSQLCRDASHHLVSVQSCNSAIAAAAAAIAVGGNPFNSRPP
jgi:hypothetical protein